MFYLASRDKSIQTLRIHQFAGITAKMGKNFAVDAIIFKILRTNNLHFSPLAQIYSVSEVQKVV